VSTNRIANRCLFLCRTWKWTKNIFHFLDLTILNSYIILYLAVVKKTIKNFVWLWFRICLKYVQGNLILILPQEMTNPTSQSNNKLLEV